MDLNLAAIAVAAYFFEQSEWAFWFVVAAIVSALLDVIEALIKLSWYIECGQQSGPYFDCGKRGFILTKLIATAILGWAACWLGFKSGYF